MGSDQVQADAAPGLDIAEQELIDALEAAAQAEGGNGALTVRELARRKRWTVNRTRSHLASLIAIGRCEVTRKQIVNIAGNSTRVPAYRIKHG